MSGDVNPPLVDLEDYIFDCLMVNVPPQFYPHEVSGKKLLGLPLHISVLSLLQHT